MISDHNMQFHNSICSYDEGKGSLPWTSLAACHILRCLNSCLLSSGHCLQLFSVPFFFLCGFSGQLEAITPQCGGPSAPTGSIKKGCPVETAAAPQEVTLARKGNALSQATVPRFRCRARVAPCAPTASFSQPGR